MANHESKNNNYEQEPNKNIKIEKILWIINQGDMLALTPNDIKLYRYVETGESEQRSVSVGDETYTFNIPIKEPALFEQHDSLWDMPAPKYEQTNYFEQNTGDIESEEYRAWKESLVSVSDVRVAAESELKRREKYGDDEIIDCANCRGGGSPNCPYCQGGGKAAKYPYILLKNELTGEQNVLKLDLAELVASGDVKVGWGGFENSYSEDNYSSEQILHFEVSAYIDREIANLGIDKENAVKVWGDGASRLWTGQSRAEGLRAYRSSHEGSVNQGYHLKAENGAEALENGQRMLSRAHSWRYGRIKDENGVVFAEEWLMRPIRPLEESLNDLKTALHEKGYDLGFTHSFIATGEVGPSFYALDEKGNALQQLSNDYDVRESLENAWLAFQKLSDEKQLP